VRLRTGKVNHSTWEHVVQGNIFVPLQMTASVTSLKQLSAVADHATGYIYKENSKTWQAVPPPQSLQALAPGGNIAATIRWKVL
jgi:hypothetical protein